MFAHFVYMDIKIIWTHEEKGPLTLFHAGLIKNRNEQEG